MKKREESFVGDNTVKIYEMIKKWGKSKYPIGALIPEKERPEWDKFRNRCKQYGVEVSGGGFMFALKWANEILDATCPVAEEIGYHPFGLCDDYVRMYVNLIKEINKDGWIKESSNLRKDIVNGSKDQMLIIIKKINNHHID